MDDRLKQRLIGAAVLVIAAVIFVPMLLESDGESPATAGHTVVPLPAPASEAQPVPEPEDASARVIPLDDNAPAAAQDAARASSEPARDAPAATAPASGSGATAAAPAASTSAGGAGAHATGFAVQLGSFTKVGNARGLRDRLVSKGYPAYMVTTNSVTRVYVGPQPSRTEAERVLKKLLAETKLKGIVVEHAG